MSKVAVTLFTRTFKHNGHTIKATYRPRDGMFEWESTINGIRLQGCVDKMSRVPKAAGRRIDKFLELYHDCGPT